MAFDYYKRLVLIVYKFIYSQAVGTYYICCQFNIDYFCWLYRWRMLGTILLSS